MTWAGDLRAQVREEFRAAARRHRTSERTSQEREPAAEARPALGQNRRAARRRTIIIAGASE
jgi:hypothetical protein